MAEEGSRVYRGAGRAEVVMDDFLVVGCGDTVKEAMTNHDQNLFALLDRPRKRNLKLNSEKTSYASRKCRLLAIC